jgi:hypothetical protein
MDMAAAMGIELLTEEQYRELQKLAVFVYHNSAPSYYAARGFRGSLRI